MSKVKFEYDSTALVEVLGQEEASDYLNLAKATFYRATIVRIYGLILILISLAVLMIIGMAFQDRDSTARMEFLKNERLWATLLSVLPFTILGIYLGYRANRIRNAAREQVEIIESSLTNFARENL